jgi:glutaredoxin 3
MRRTGRRLTEGSADGSTGAEHREARGFHRRMPKELPILYTKRGCPWCDAVVEFLDGNGVSYRLKEVTADAEAYREMETKSGQTKAPTLDWNGKVLADFGVEELVPFLQGQNVKLEDS